VLIAPPASILPRDARGALHVVALSGGKDSTAMAFQLRERHPETPFVHVCTPTGDELPDMVAHWVRVGDRLGSRIWPISVGKSLDGLCKDQNALPNWRQRWCTRILKIEPYAAWLTEMVKAGPVVSYVGLRADEPEREGGDYASIPNVEMRFPMREWGWGLDDVLTYLDAIGICIPRRTDCAKCYHQTLYEWFRLWADHPETYAEAEALEARTGHTFRSPSRDTWPAALSEMRLRFAAGDIPQTRKRATQCRVCTL
jgi:hypothetical protein